MGLARVYRKPAKGGEELVKGLNPWDQSKSWVGLGAPVCGISGPGSGAFKDRRGSERMQGRA